MLTPLQCIDYIFTRGEAEGLHYEILGDDTDTLIHKRDDGEVVIAFCGSNSKVDWKNNFHFWKKAYKDAEVTFTAHSGFLKCWKLIRHEVEDRVKALNPTSITVTGHSYGGAIAVLCSEDMKYCFPEIETQMITFGAPRVIGWLNWRKIRDRWSNSRQFRHGSDFVTCVPFFGMLFHHVTRRICIGDKPYVLGWFRTVEYHDLDKYCETLKKISK